MQLIVTDFFVLFPHPNFDFSSGQPNCNWDHSSDGIDKSRLSFSSARTLSQYLQVISVSSVLPCSRFEKYRNATKYKRPKLAVKMLFFISNLASNSLNGNRFILSTFSGSKSSVTSCSKSRNFPESVFSYFFGFFLSNLDFDSTRRWRAAQIDPVAYFCALLFFY